MAAQFFRVKHPSLESIIIFFWLFCSLKENYQRQSREREGKLLTSTLNHASHHSDSSTHPKRLLNSLLLNTNDFCISSATKKKSKSGFFLGQPCAGILRIHHPKLGVCRLEDRDTILNSCRYQMR